MTVTQYQTVLHGLYQLDSATPGSSDEDWTIRLNLLVVAVNLWAGEEGIQWRELWTTANGTTSSATTYALSSIFSVSNFRFPGGFIRIQEVGTQWTYWPILDQPKSELFKNYLTQPKFAWFTGNKQSGITLNLSVAPTSGVAIQFPYYKDPFEPSATSDVIEMADPYFAIYYALSKLHESDGEGDRASLALQMAESRLRAMKFQNAKAPYLQENYIPDRDLEQGIAGMGL